MDLGPLSRRSVAFLPSSLQRSKDTLRNSSATSEITMFVMYNAVLLPLLISHRETAVKNSFQPSISTLFRR